MSFECVCVYDSTKKRDFVIVVRDGGMEMEWKSTQPAHLFFVFVPGQLLESKRGSWLCLWLV